MPLSVPLVVGKEIDTEGFELSYVRLSELNATFPNASDKVQVSTPLEVTPVIFEPEITPPLPVQFN